MDAYKILLWTTDPLLVLAVGAAFGALIGFGATFALLLGPHTRAAQAVRETVFLNAYQNRSGGTPIPPSTSRNTCLYTRQRMVSGSEFAMRDLRRETNCAFCAAGAEAIATPMTAESAATVSASPNSSVFNATPGECDPSVRPLSVGGLPDITGLSCDVRATGETERREAAFLEREGRA